MLPYFRSVDCLSKRLQEFNSGGNKVKTKKTSPPLPYLLRANHAKKQGEATARSLGVRRQKTSGRTLFCRT